MKVFSQLAIPECNLTPMNFLWDMNRVRPSMVHRGSLFSHRPRPWVRQPVTLIDAVVRWLSIRVRRFFGRS